MTTLSPARLTVNNEKQLMNTLHIFVSYSRNRRAVKDFVDDLVVLGNEVWFDQKLTGGHEWWRDILDRIFECDLFVYSVTPESLRSVACRLELNYALSLRKRILPVVMDKGIDINAVCRDHPALREIQVIDYSRRRLDSYKQLIAALRALPPAQPIPDPLPTRPLTPKSPIDHNRERIQANSQITQGGQNMIVMELRSALNDWETAIKARELLTEMEKRSDSTLTTQRGIAEILDDRALGMLDGHDAEVRRVDITSDGKWMVTASLDGSAQVWKAESGVLAWPLELGPSYRVMSAVFNPKGNHLAVAVSDGSLRILIVQSGNQRAVFNAHTGGVLWVAYSPTGELMVTGGCDGLVQVWDVKQEARLFSLDGHLKPVTCAAFSPDSKRLVSTSIDATVRIWDVASRSQVRLLSGHAQPVNSAMFSPDGKHVLSAGLDGTARIWDAITGKEMVKLTPGTGEICWAGYSRDGRTIVTASDDHKTRLWDAPSGACLTVLGGHTRRVTYAVFTDNDAHLLTASRDQTVRRWYVADVINRD